MASKDTKVKKEKPQKRENVNKDTNQPKSKKAKNEPSSPSIKKETKVKNGDTKPKMNGKVKKEVQVKSEEMKEKELKRQARLEAKLEQQKLEEEMTWKWWEEMEDGGEDDGEKKWSTLEHNGPYFPPEYERLPANVNFYYDGKPMKLNIEAEEAAFFYAHFIEHDYTTKEIFKKNFFEDFKSLMNDEENEKIKTLDKCDFKQIFDHLQSKRELKKQMTTEEKNEIKAKNKAIDDKYGYCKIDGHRQKIGNFKIEPPGLFRGRGEHPKMGMLKKRIVPEQVIINCSPENIPTPPEGHNWKEVRHCDTVSWLATWTENIQGQKKYVMLNAASKFKSQKDFQKYENARKLHAIVDKIRADYREGMKSEDSLQKQRAVAMYFIDRLALRAGNEKDEDEADTVGCCSLRVEHIKLHKTLPDNPEVGPAIEFDFLGKDSIRYYNVVQVPKRVFLCLKQFVTNKKGDDDLFDKLSTTSLNKYLSSVMSGLTAKVFRTYNASITLERELAKEIIKGTVEEKLLSYNRANKSVAILCNHQRAVPKTHETSMQNLQTKIDKRKEQIKDLKKEIKQAKDDKKLTDRLNKKLTTGKEQLKKLEIQQVAKEENKQIALGTSKLNYLDPRITIAWCLDRNVPVEKVFNKTQRQKFNWAISMTERGYKFADMPENANNSEN